MNHAEQNEENFEKGESKKNSTAWLVKCSQEQKEILQKKSSRIWKKCCSISCGFCSNIGHKRGAFRCKQGNTKRILRDRQSH